MLLMPSPCPAWPLACAEPRSVLTKLEGDSVASGLTISIRLHHSPELRRQIGAVISLR